MPLSELPNLDQGTGLYVARHNAQSISLCNLVSNPKKMGTFVTVITYTKQL